MINSDLNTSLAGRCNMQTYELYMYAFMLFALARGYYVRNGGFQ